MWIFCGTLATTSRHYPLIATIVGSSLLVYKVPTSQFTRKQYAETVHEIALDPAFSSNIKTISFSPQARDQDTPRILVATTTTVHIYSALPEEPKFHASISNAASPSPSLQDATFLSPNEVILVPNLAPRITIRDIATGFGVELRDIKHTSSISTFTTRTRQKASAYSIREKSGHAAFLTQPNVGKDIVVVLASSPSTSNGSRTVEVEFAIATSDAQGLLFSPNGVWIAIWDAPSAAHSGSVYIYTATGQLLKQWRDSVDADLCLGVKSISWLNDGRLVIATVDGRVVVLTADSFQEQIMIRHPKTIENTSETTMVYIEQISTNGTERTYAPATLPAVPPSNKSTKTETPPRGILHLEISATGELLASVDALTPTTVHITSLQSRATDTKIILIHHAVIKSLEWSPAPSDWLLIRTSQKTNIAETVHIWNLSLPEPHVITATLPAHVTKSSTTSIGSRTLDSTTTWATLPKHLPATTIPQILFSFENVALLLPAEPQSQAQFQPEDLSTNSNDDTPRPVAPHVHDIDPQEETFDQSFEDLRAESSILAHKSGASARAQYHEKDHDDEKESVTDGGFSPVKFDAGDWTRRQILHLHGEAEEEADDTFVRKKGRK